LKNSSQNRSNCQAEKAKYMPWLQLFFAL